MAGTGSPQATAAALAAMESAIIAKGAPYAPLTAGLGSPPTKIPDIPVTAVFLVLFLISAVLNMRLLMANRKRGHKFLFNGLMFGFSMARITSTSLRIAWTLHLENTKLAIAANIFLYAGVIILYVVNLFFTQRIVRARHPHFGWSKPFKAFVPATVAVIILGILMVIIVLIQSFYTLDRNTHRIDRDIQLAVTTAFTVVAFIPIPIVITTLLVPRRVYIDKFGAGRYRTKCVLLMFTSALLTLGAAFRCGTSYLPPVSIFESPWYFSKACFYVFTFTIENIVLITYLVARVDRRFHVPDGASAYGDYSGETSAKSPREWPQSLYDTTSEPYVDSEKQSTSYPSMDGRPVSGHSFLAVDPQSGRYHIRSQSVPSIASQSTTGPKGKELSDI